MIHTKLDRRPKLEVEGETFHSSSINKDLIEKIAADLRECHPTLTFKIKSFLVHIKEIDRKTDTVLGWEKRDGYSIWYRPKDSYQLFSSTD